MSELEKSLKILMNRNTRSPSRPAPDNAEWAKEEAERVINEWRRRMIAGEPGDTLGRLFAAALADAQDKALERAEKKFRHLSEQSGESPVSAVDGKWQAAGRVIRSLRSTLTTTIRERDELKE